MNTEWQCPLCRASNLVPAPICRVCRTLWTGIRSQATPAEDEAEPTFGVLESLPGPAFLLLLAVTLLVAWPEVAGAFSVPNQHSGWTASVRGERRAELRIARAELEDLANELLESLQGSQTLSPDFNDRLIATRQKWQIYGESERTPQLGAAEVKLHSAVIEIANIRYLVSAGQNPSELLERMTVVLTVLSTVREDLDNA